MHFTAFQADLKEALDFVKPATNRSPLVCIKAIEGKGRVEVIAQSSEMTLRHDLKARVETEGVWGVPYYVLNDMLATLNPHEVVTLKLDKKNGILSLEQGKTKANIKGVQDYDVPLTTPPTDFILEGATLRRIAEAVGMTAGKNDPRPSLNGVHWKIDEPQGTLEAAATDGFRLSILTVNFSRTAGRPREPYTCLIPAPSLKEVSQRYGDKVSVFVSVTEGDVVVFRDEHNNSLIACQQIASRELFPDYQAIVPDNNEITASLYVPADSVSTALKTINPFTHENLCVLRVRPDIPDNGPVYLTAVSPEEGDSMRVIEGVSGINGQAQDVALNAAFLDDVTKALRGRAMEMRLISAHRPVLFGEYNSPSYLHVIMPMNPGR